MACREIESSVSDEAFRGVSSNTRVKKRGCSRQVAQGGQAEDQEFDETSGSSSIVEAEEPDAITHATDALLKFAMSHANDLPVPYDAQTSTR